jgi:flagellar basal-body rod modification protein FlgD
MKAFKTWMTASAVMLASSTFATAGPPPTFTGNVPHDFVLGGDVITVPDPGGVSDLFLKLLASQLKSQSPLDPVDPTQFVGQLIQFNSLSQLMQIRQLLGTKTSSHTASSNPLPSVSATQVQGDH